ncbi:MAG TPA: hypothetical protein VLK65_13740 [Vicinamibacteria bacterium]|nr:hypothetical protein [Vicinamibacteria bacterium]
MLKRALIFSVVGVSMAVFFSGDVGATRYIYKNGIKIECCSDLKSTVVISGIMGLREKPFRIIVYDNLVGTAICRHNNTGELVGVAFTGPSKKIMHTATFVVTDDDSSFDKSGDTATSITSGDILNSITAAEACPNDVSFTLVDFDLDALSYEDTIVVCSKFGPKKESCLTFEEVNVVTGNCTWTEENHVASCTEVLEHHHSN